MAQESVMATTGVIDVHAFNAGLFMWKADVLSPIEFNFEDPRFPVRPLEDAMSDMNGLNNRFFPFVVQGGIGLYSLVEGPAGLLTKYDIEMRRATKKEMERDFQYFGEQVMGAEVGTGEDEEHKGNSTFKVWGKDYYYVGPPRFIRARFATRVFPGEMPDRDGLAEIVGQVDELGLEEGKTDSLGEVVAQGYRLFHADKGKIRHAGFGKFEGEGYDLSQMDELFGEVDIFDGDQYLPFIAFYPGGDRDNERDFSAVLHKDVSGDILARLRELAKPRR